MARNLLTDRQKGCIVEMLARQPLSAWAVYERLKKHPGLPGTEGAYITQRQVARYLAQSGLFVKVGANKWKLVIQEPSPILPVHFSAEKYEE
ncbi:hypothetical protein KBG31_03715 [Patescibacteria group bacterium]|nr:hypothetical protein [Patescibacteria group bacterium]